MKRSLILKKKRNACEFLIPVSRVMPIKNVKITLWGDMYFITDIINNRLHNYSSNNILITYKVQKIKNLLDNPQIFFRDPQGSRDSSASIIISTPTI